MHTYAWIKFIIFVSFGLGSAIGFIYYVLTKPNKITEIKTWKVCLALTALFGFLADRSYTILFE